MKDPRFTKLLEVMRPLLDAGERLATRSGTKDAEEFVSVVMRYTMVHNAAEAAYAAARDSKAMDMGEALERLTAEQLCAAMMPATWASTLPRDKVRPIEQAERHLKAVREVLSEMAGRQ